jgi:hypothetical protein
MLFEINKILSDVLVNSSIFMNGGNGLNDCPAATLETLQQWSQIHLPDSSLMFVDVGFNITVCHEGRPKDHGVCDTM